MKAGKLPPIVRHQMEIHRNHADQLGYGEPWTKMTRQNQVLQGLASAHALPVESGYQGQQRGYDVLCGTMRRQGGILGVIPRNEEKQPTYFDIIA